MGLLAPIMHHLLPRDVFVPSLFSHLRLFPSILPRFHRFSDKLLVALSPNINFPLYIVTPDIRLEQVRRELARPTFQVLELHKRCGFFSEESLIQNAENIMRWANHPSAIERLALKVSDVDS